MRHDMHYNGSEKRRFVRANVPCKIIIYIPAEHAITTHTENIGAGGVRVVISEKLDIFSTVSIELYLEEKVIASQGRIVWVVDKPTEAIDEPDTYDTGIEFCEITSKDRNIISDFVDKVIKNKQ